MKYLVQCQKCDCSVWIRGSYEGDTNATVLSDNDSRWLEACEHIQAGDYDILDEEPLCEEIYDHGDSVWPS
jgi:hypothetical protein